MIPPSKPPFFIVGNPRSGTTLLRFVLSSHPNLYIPDETGFLPYLLPAGHRAAPLSLADTRRVFDKLQRINPGWRALVPDVEAFYASLPAPPILADIVDMLYRQVIAPHHATRWGDKTPLYVRYIPDLDEIFPQAQFIHIIRDGRDAALSALKKWKYAYHDLTYLMHQWALNVTAGREAGQTLGNSRYLEIRYEDLVREPRTVIEMVCHFLREDFSPSMLDHTRLARTMVAGTKGHNEVLRPISDESVGRWQREMTDFEKKISARIAAPLLDELGYPLAAAPPFTSLERWQYALLESRYHAMETLRQFLYRTGLLTINRKKRRQSAIPAAPLDT